MCAPIRIAELIPEIGLSGAYYLGTLADTLKNQGASATGCRQIGYYLSSDASITTTDTLR